MDLESLIRRKDLRCDEFEAKNLDMEKYNKLLSGGEKDRARAYVMKDAFQKAMREDKEFWNAHIKDCEEINIRSADRGEL